MRLAVIDLGTNSVRFDVHQFGPGRNVRTLHREKIMVRLGQGVFTTGHLDPNAIARTIHAFQAFKRLAAELRVSRILALGTSALREAHDGDRLVRRVRKSTGIDVRVISGREEARLIALGILSNERNVRGKVGLIDIGGGSTEVSVTNRKQILNSQSFPLGTARLQQVFLKKSPPSRESVDQLRAYIRKLLHAKIHEQKWPKPSVLIGSSGTIRALAKILKKSTGKKTLRLKDLSALVKKMSKMNTTQLLGLPGIESKRVDMILAGAVLLEETMIALKVEELRATEYSLRDGILEEQIQISKQHLTSRIGLHLTDLVDKATRLGGKRPRLNALITMSEALFKGMAPVHKLARDCRLYLDAAAVLRNTGEAVSLVGNPEHSYYIVKNAHFPFIEEWESELVAQLCLHHEHTQLDRKELPFRESRSRQLTFQKLLAMLTVIDALDADKYSFVTIRKVRVTRSGVEISFSGGTASDLELFRAEQRRALFRAVFRRELIVKRV